MFGVDDVLNEVYPLPYFFDILHFEKISNEQLIEHINFVGKEIYSSMKKQKFDDADDNKKVQSSYPVE